MKNRNRFDAGEEAPLATPQFTGVNEDVRLGLNVLRENRTVFRGSLNTF